MKQLIRSQYNSKGYVYAASAADVAKESGFEKIARMGSNENPFPTPAAILAAACAALPDINRYPDPASQNLTAAIRRENSGASVVVSGCGMDGVIETALRMLIDPGDKVVISTPTFSVYGLMARSVSAHVVNVPRTGAEFAVDVDAFIAEAKDAKISFLCSPNNPTGTVTPVEDVKKILANIDGVLFLDCAYVEFSDIDYRPLLASGNLVIGRTMSKVYGLAGLRIGYALVPEWFTAPYAAAVTPFTLNCVSEAAACAALAHPELRTSFVSFVREWREKFLREIPFPVLPSGANFVLINTAPLKSDEAVHRLAKAGVLVRSCSSFPGLGDTYIRVSIGDVWENERFLAAVKGLC
ncbi:MAG: histidinol-phosphate transaminase [Methanocorpusculum sp.]|nr:histidinol-phosphate transaminase [Methanocorpusculum sp.]